MDMSLDEQVLHDVETTRIRLEALEDQAYEARAAFHSAIRRLHASGGSMREIATALGMSHQRVHQIIGTDGIVEVEPSAVTDVTTLPPAPTEAASPAPAAPAGAVAVAGGAATAVAVAAAPAAVAAHDACSLCATPRRALDRLLAGPGPVFICDACVHSAAEVIAARADRGDLRAVPVEAEATCSFCGSGSSIGGVMAEAVGRTARICARCTSTCERLVAEDSPDRPMVRRNTRIRCSFCNVASKDAERLFAGPAVHICDGCVGAARTVVDSGRPAKGPRSVVLRPAAGEDHPCSFCARNPATAAAMVKGGRGRICDRCLDRCDTVVAQAG